MSQKKALIFSPYLNTLGGGEVYSLQLARCLQLKGFEIEIAWKNYQDIKKAQKLFSIPLDFTVNKLAYEVLTSKTSLWKKFLTTRKYSIVFFVSDGSIPYLFGEKNWLHFQVPFTNLNTSFASKLKLKNISQIICNSKFTLNHIQAQLHDKCVVIYPPVINQNQLEVEKKEKILAMGRFTNTLHNKRQDILIHAFAKLYNAGYTSWTLTLIGSTSQSGSQELVKNLKIQAKGLPVEFITNASYGQLQTAYAQAKIFWHAAGYEIDESKHPESVEHFGIATVEAMQASCIPIVINKGGQKEIVNDGHNGFLFNTVEELVSKTKIVISSPRKSLILSQKAMETSQKFSNERFCMSIGKII